MKRRTAKRIWGVICFLGLMLVLGTVGAMENESITLVQGLVQSGIGLVAFAGAAYIGGFLR